MGTNDSPTGGPEGQRRTDGSGVLADLQHLLSGAAELIARSRALLAEITALFVPKEEQNQADDQSRKEAEDGGGDRDDVP